MTDERSAWLAWRRSGIGASDVAGILGLSPWATPYSVWASKVADVDDTPSEAMEFGQRAEPMLARWFHDRHPELYVLGEQTRCTHRAEPWMLCTVDGFLYETPEPADVGDYVSVVEFKSTSDRVGVWEERIPDHYACQATWTMAVCDVDVVHFGVLHLAYGRPVFRTYEFHRDADDEKLLIGVCGAFWRENVLAGLPPAIDAHQATYDAVRWLYPAVTADAVPATDDLRALVDEYRYHRAEAKAATERQEFAAARLRAAIADGEGISDGTIFLATNRTQERRTIDAERLRAEHPDIAAEFTTIKSQRVLRVP